MYVKPTTVYKVENKNRHKTANPHYYLVVTENEGCLLFTKADIEKAKSRTKTNPEDVPRHKKVNTVDWDICLGFAAITTIGGVILGYFSDFILNKIM